MARYRRLSLMEREELSRMLATGSSLRAAGQALADDPRPPGSLKLSDKENGYRVKHRREVYRS